MNFPHYLGRKGLPVSVAAVFMHLHGDELTGHGRRLLEGGPLSSGEETAYIIVSIALVAISGIAAGLTLGLLSLDKVDLEVLKRTGNQKQRWLVSQVEPLISRPHWVLVSLLLLNSACFEALPIFLDRLLNPVAAILISVTAILVFGEIMPQAVCKRYGLHVGAYLSWLVRIIMWVTCPISWPISKLLDWLLGEETALFRRAELRALMTLHAEPEGEDGESMLTPEEVNVIHGALDMAHKTAENAMTPLEKVFMLPSDEHVDKSLLQRIIDCGHSRIPVHQSSDKKNIIGLILVKELVSKDLDEGLVVRECKLREIDHIVADTPLYSVLELFRLKRRHMAAVTRYKDDGSVSVKGKMKGGSFAELNAAAVAVAVNGPEVVTAAVGAGVQDAPPAVEVVGIITIEDVIEELLQHEIIDETDVYVDNLQTEIVMPVSAAAQLPPELKKYISKTYVRQGGPSARPSPVKKTSAVVAAAAGAAYAVARQNATYQRPPSAAGTSNASRPNPQEEADKAALQDPLLID